MKKNALLLLLLAAVGTGMLSCKKQGEKTIAADPSKNELALLASTPCGCWIGCCNQQNNTIEVYDPAVYYWDDASALKWSFKPSTSRGYSDYEISLWNGGPAALKLRNTTAFSGTTQAIVTAAGQLATIAAYPSGNKIWVMGYAASPAVSIHSAELLPNGNIALASADRNWVRVYSSSQPVPNHDKFGEFPLGSAHAVLWDPTYNRLWVTGWLPINSNNYWDPLNQVLTALIVTDSAGYPRLAEDASKRAILPGKYGHDVYPVYYDVNKLWVTVNVDNADNTKGTYIYDKLSKTFTPAPGAANRNFVKSIGNQPSGQIVELRPENAETGAWVNDSVSFYNNDGSYHTSRFKTGAKFYKARVFSPDYQ
jgi:hypothetical protein